jgi:hypothetical protein
MIERATGRAPASRGRRGVVTRRFGANCETKFVEALGLDLPAELANKFERHLRTKTKAGRLLLALETQESL